MIIRKANKPDAESLAIVATCVWIDSYLIEGVDDVVTDYIHCQFSVENMRRIIEDRHVYLMEKGQGPIGYVVVTIEMGKSEIENFYILPKHQGCGLGKQLLDHLRSKHTNLWLSCWFKNKRALRFYYANDFIKTGETWFQLGEEQHRNEVLTSTK